MDWEIKERFYQGAVVVSFLIGITIGFYIDKNVFKDDAEEGAISVEGAKTTLKKIEDKEVEDICEIWVDVRGAVINPGVYCLDENSIVNDAIKVSGGIYKEVYAFRYVSQKVNLATRIQDGQKIYIPFKEDVVCKKKEEKVEDPSGVNDAIEDKIVSKDLQDINMKNELCISINKATQAELESLSGVGPSTAQKIIEGRSYSKLSDLKEVSGIGEATYSKFENDICL